MQKELAIKKFIYVGFWRRALACIVDNIIFIALLSPFVFLYYHYNSDINGFRQIITEISNNNIITVIYIVSSSIYTIIFWVFKGATPGKMLFKMKVVNEKTMQNPSFSVAVSRYIGYTLSLIPLYLGILWVAFSKKKQGFHDKLAKTIVINT